MSSDKSTVQGMLWQELAGIDCRSMQEVAQPQKLFAHAKSSWSREQLLVQKIIWHWRSDSLTVRVERERERDITSCQPERADHMFCNLHTSIPDQRPSVSSDVQIGTQCRPVNLDDLRQIAYTSCHTGGPRLYLPILYILSNSVIS